MPEQFDRSQPVAQRILSTPGRCQQRRLHRPVTARLWADTAFATLLHLAIHLKRADRSDREKLRRFIKKRTTGNFRPSGNFHEATLHQGLQHSIDADSPDRFDIGTYNRLAVGNDCERLERGRG